MPPIFSFYLHMPPFLSARLFHLSSSTVLRHSCDIRGNPIVPVDQYWNKLRVLGVAIWTDVWVSRGYFFPRPPPSDVMSRLALWRVSGELKKNTKLWIQFNLVSAMKNNLQVRRGGSGNADMFQSIFSDWFLLVRADDKTLKRRDDTISSWKQKDKKFKRRPTGGS